MQSLHRNLFSFSDPLPREQTMKAFSFLTLVICLSSILCLAQPNSDTVLTHTYGDSSNERSSFGLTMFQDPFWLTPDGSFWINVIAGVVTSILVSIIVLLAIRLWHFSFVKLAFDRFWGSDRLRQGKTFVVIDLLTNISTQPARYLHKIVPDAAINGPTEVVGDCNPRAVQYIASAFAKVTKIDPVTKFDTEIHNTWEANFICLGSDASNVKTHAILSHPNNKFVSFVDNGQAILWLPSGQKYDTRDGRDKGVILKLHNPFFADHWVIVCAGLGVWGSSGTAFYLARHWKNLEKRFGQGEFAMILSVGVNSDESAEELIATTSRTK
jgi:hypothetical protein